MAPQTQKRLQKIDELVEHGKLNQAWKAIYRLWKKLGWFPELQGLALKLKTKGPCL